MIIGTAGHIDHGKTSLVRALTGVDTDRLKEEKARGISIELGFAYLPAPDGAVLGFIDVPGHEKFIHTMLAGATGIDFALLVIAADDGVMPQTLEHLAILDLLGVSQGIVALTKCDLMSASRRDEVTIDIANLLAPTRLSGAAIMPVSTVTGEGIEPLRERLFEAAATAGHHASDGLFRLAVDRSFTLAGAGTVVTGTVLSGHVAVGDRVVISPSGREARVRSIHAQNRVADRGIAGDRCALNLAGDGITKDAISRGDVVLDAGLHAPADRIDVVLRLLPSEVKPVTPWFPVRLHHAAAEVGARVVLLGDDPVAPGAEAFVQLVLERPIAAAVGDRFVLRDTTAQRTIGGGTLLDLRAPGRKRRTPERLAQLQACAMTDPAGGLSALLDRAPYHVELTGFARDRALSSAQMGEIAARLGLLRTMGAGMEFALSPPVWLRFKQGLLATLEQFHLENPDLPGLGLERLRLQLEPRLPAPAFRSFLQKLADGSAIALHGAWVRLATHEVRLTPADEQSWAKIAPRLSDAERFRPPRVRDIAGLLTLREPDVRRLLKLLGRLGRVDEVAHDHFFLRSTVAEMVDIIVDLAAAAENGQFTAAQFRDRVDNGRKVAIQILEFFDRHGVTLRRGDLRRINRHRLDLFRFAVAETPQSQTASGRESSPVGRPDFKSGKGREPVLGGFDSLSLPPRTRGVG
jgi:selenocysteine-specific elongation factor